MGNFNIFQPANRDSAKFATRKFVLHKLPLISAKTWKKILYFYWQNMLDEIVFLSVKNMSVTASSSVLFQFGEFSRNWAHFLICQWQVEPWRTANIIRYFYHLYC